MKKQYEAPVLTLLALKEKDFLSTSGDAIGADRYDGYGESFS